MKVDQACRFRLDEGYCVFAKSAGLKPAQEEALGDAFNSTMNTIFPRTGASILSCALGRNDGFLARNTLRTDVLGRKTIFTHAYIFSVEEYARVMEEEPLTLLSIPMEQMLDSQPGTAQMDQLELTAPQNSEITLERLFQKYQLTPQRYGRLLLGAYEAMTSNKSLRLKTNRPLEQTEQMIREMTYCILDGLLPVLRGKVSFSSGADIRMKISVIAAGDPAGDASDIIFGVEDDGFTNIRPRDEVSAMVFDALGRLSHEHRRQVLVQMQDWLHEVTNVQEGLSVMLVSAAYCLSSGQDLSPDTMMMLFRNISASARGFSNYVTNSLLTDLLRRMNERGFCSPKALSQIAGWYLKDSTPAYRQEADRALAAAPVEICVALVEAVFKQTMTDNVRQMLQVLLRRIPAESAALSSETRNQVVLWILAENVEQFTEYATVLMMNYNDSQTLQLAKGILNGSRGRTLSSAEDAMLSKALHRMLNVRVGLTEEECALLDSHSQHYSAELCASAMDYFFRVRLAVLDVEAGLALLERLRAEQPVYFSRIKAELISGRRDTGALWEHYQARHCFRRDMTSEEIGQVCKEYNTFNNPGGPFEKVAVNCWVKLIEGSFASHSESSTALQYLAETLFNRWLDNTAMLNISSRAKGVVEGKIAEIFWDSVSFTQIYANDKPIPDRLRVQIPQSRLKLQLLEMCIGLRRDPRDTRQFIKLIQSEDSSDQDWNELKNCASGMVFTLLKEKQFLSWDLVLLSCWVRTDKGGTVDTEALFDVCTKLDVYFERQCRSFHKDPGASLLLRDDKVSKAVCKMGNNLPKVLQELIDELKQEKKNLLHNLFGGQSRGKEPQPEKRQSDRQAEEFQRRDNRRARFFDPTAEQIEDAPPKDKKGKGNFRR